MATQQERKLKTRLTIIKSAKKLFEKQGFDKTSLEQLIVAANVAKGTFYQHFKSKLEVLIAMERESRRDKTREALTEIANGTPPLIILEKYLESLAEWFEAREKLAEAVILSSLSKTSDDTNTDPELSTRGFIHALFESAQTQGIVRKDADAWELTAIMCGSISVAVLGWSQHPEAGKLIVTLKRLMRLLLEGVQNTEEYP